MAWRRSVDQEHWWCPCQTSSGKTLYLGPEQVGLAQDEQELTVHRDLAFNATHFPSVWLQYIYVFHITLIPLLETAPVSICITISTSLELCSVNNKVTVSLSRASFTSRCVASGFNMSHHYSLRILDMISQIQKETIFQYLKDLFFSEYVSSRCHCTIHSQWHDLPTLLRWMLWYFFTVAMVSSSLPSLTIRIQFIYRLLILFEIMTKLNCMQSVVCKNTEKFLLCDFISSELQMHLVKFLDGQLLTQTPTYHSIFLQLFCSLTDHKFVSFSIFLKKICVSGNVCIWHLSVTSCSVWHLEEIYERVLWDPAEHGSLLSCWWRFQYTVLKSSYLSTSRHLSLQSVPYC